jgi:hypothetical protein
LRLNYLLTVSVKSIVATDICEGNGFPE